MVVSPYIGPTCMGKLKLYFPLNLTSTNTKVENTLKANLKHFNFHRVVRFFIFYVLLPKKL